MTRSEGEPVTTITRTKVLRISEDKDRDGNTVRVAHVNVPGASIIALGENHGVNPGQDVDIVQEVYRYPNGRRETSSRVRKVSSPPTP